MRAGRLCVLAVAVLTMMFFTRVASAQITFPNNITCFGMLEKIQPTPQNGWKGWNKHVYSRSFSVRSQSEYRAIIQQWYDHITSSGGNSDDCYPDDVVKQRPYMLRDAVRYPDTWYREESASKPATTATRASDVAPADSQTLRRKGVCGYYQGFPDGTLNKAYFTKIFDTRVPASSLGANSLQDKQKKEFKEYVDNKYGVGPQGFTLYCHYFRTSIEAERELQSEKGRERGTNILRSEIVDTWFIPQ